MECIGTAIIGCGKVAETHALAFNRLPQARLVGVYDSNPERAAQFAARYGAQPFSDLLTMLANPGVQMASICTPPYAHPDQVEACAAAGVHARVEKPMAVDLQGCNRAIAAAERAGVRLGVVSQRRFYEPVRRVKAAIETGKIGHPMLGTVTVMGWRDEAYYRMDAWRGKWATEGGGVLLNQTTHQMDVFQWLMGRCDEVFGYWANLTHPYIEVEDTAVAVVRFKSGALGSLLVSNSQKPGFYGKIHVHGANGASVGVQTDGGSPFISGVTQAAEPPFNDVWTVPGEEDLLAGWQAQDRAGTVEVMNDYHRLQIADFLDAIIAKRPPAVDGREGRKVVELFTAIYRSQRDGRPIKFPLAAELGSQDFDGRLSQNSMPS